MFDYYNKQGPLYININKQTGDKYQFHFESGSFMDAEDKKISPKKIGLSEGAVNYYKSIGKEPYFIYDKVDKYSDEFAKVKKNGKGWNIINSQGELVWKEDEWFDYVYNFYDGFAKVELGYKINFINKQGELVWKEDKWFDKVYTFSNGFACVKLEGKYNYINTQGELLWKEDKWFDVGYNFSNGFAKVKYKGDWYKLNTKGELIEN